MAMPVLKMYQTSRHRGDTSEHWEDCWAHHDFEEAVRFCGLDPLQPLFERYVPPGSRLLEGGCGSGQYVAHYTDHGRLVVGVDFARDALARLRARRPDLRLCTANVERLPMSTASFDAYYSGGVVEHLEDGPEKALSEARRVLRENGVLLCGVPFYNPLRRALAISGHRDWERLSGPVISRLDGGRVFWQYAFTRAEFEKILRRQGFEVVDFMGYSILWGLYELPGIAALTGLAHSLWRRRSPRASCGTRAMTVPSTRRPSLVRRLVVSEDTSIPLLGWVVRFLRATTANMMMFVCVKRGSAP